MCLPWTTVDGMVASPPLIINDEIKSNAAWGQT